MIDGLSSFFPIEIDSDHEAINEVSVVVLTLLNYAFLNMGIDLPFLLGSQLESRSLKAMAEPMVKAISEP